MPPTIAGGGAGQRRLNASVGQKYNNNFSLYYCLYNVNSGIIMLKCIYELVKENISLYYDRPKSIVATQDLGM